jgi:hypothetical protein
MARLSSEELAEIVRFTSELPVGGGDAPPWAARMNSYARKLGEELAWVTAERDAWKARYYRLAEALSKASPAGPYFDGDAGTISVVNERSSDGEQG